MYGLKTEASFDSAHFLTDYYGKCENLHGHRWRAVVYLEVADLQADGTMKDMVVDFGVFKRAVRDPVSYTHLDVYKRQVYGRDSVIAVDAEDCARIDVQVRS